MSKARYICLSCNESDLIETEVCQRGIPCTKCRGMGTMVDSYYYPIRPELSKENCQEQNQGAKIIINKLNDVPQIFIDGKEVKGIISISYKYHTSEVDKSGIHHYTIKYLDDVDMKRHKEDPTIKTITVEKV